MKKFLLLLAFGLIGLTACKKDDPVAPEKTRKDFLTEATWKYKTFNNQLRDCEADDVFTFGTDNKFTIDYGNNLCVSNETMLVGDWTFFEDDTKIAKVYQAFGNTLHDTLNIIKLDASTFEYIDENNNHVIMQH